MQCPPCFIITSLQQRPRSDTAISVPAHHLFQPSFQTALAAYSNIRSPAETKQIYSGVPLQRARDSQAKRASTCIGSVVPWVQLLIPAFQQRDSQHSPFYSCSGGQWHSGTPNHDVREVLLHGIPSGN